MPITLGQGILWVLMAGLFLLLLLIVLKLFRDGFWGAPPAEKQASRQAVVNELFMEAQRGMLLKYQHLPIEQRNAVKEIVGELVYFFSRHEADQKISTGRILSLLHKYQLQGKEFGELHQLIRGVLRENQLTESEIFDKLSGYDQPAEK